MTQIAEDDRVYATEDITMGYDGSVDVPKGTEGTMCFTVEHEVMDYFIEWDNGTACTVAGDMVALVPVSLVKG